MPRSESRTKTGIWNDTDFRALSKDAQRLYWLLYSQGTISLCGVIAYTPGKWARMAKDDTVDQIEATLHELEKHDFIVVDWEEEEVFVRSFMRNDGVWNSPKTRSAAIAASKHITSARILAAYRVEVERLNAELHEKELNAQANTLCAESG